LFFRKREGQYEDMEEENVEGKQEKPLPENLITLEEYKHKSVVGEKDPKSHEPPVLGSHSDSLGFKTAEAVEKKNETKQVRENK